MPFLRITQIIVFGFIIALILVGCTADESQTMYPMVKWEEKFVDELPGKIIIFDVDGDGINDLLQVNTNGRSFAWFRCDSDQQLIKYVILEDTPFSGDRIAYADIDRDGDFDVIAGLNISTEGQQKNYRVIWLENPRQDSNPALPESWNVNTIGNQESYIKDIAIGDFNRDEKVDVVIRVEKNTTSIFIQRTPDTWDKKIVLSHERNEGMDVADLDLDGDPDIVLNGFWYETPAELSPQNFRKHVFDKKWFTPKDHSWRDNNAVVKVIDLNQDGLRDILISQSELPGFPISCYTAKSIQAIRNDEWTEIQLSSRFDFCQTLDAGDIDNDGDIDVLAAKFERDRNNKRWMNDPPFPVVVFYNVKGTGQTWQQQLLSEEGLYAGLLGDLGNDGDLDIFGTRSYWDGPVKLWINAGIDDRLTLDQFTYIQVDNSRAERFFGLATGDLNGDGLQDIAAGKWYYQNPGGNMDQRWKRIEFPQSVDALLIMDVDNDEFGDVIALKCNAQYWLESQDKQGQEWGLIRIGSLEICDHKISTQFYGLGQIASDGKPEIILDKYYFRIPENPGKEEWPAVRYSNDGTGYAVGDVDGDGLMDIAGKYVVPGNDEVVPGTVNTKWWNSVVCWWKNPGDDREYWQRFDIGLATQADRFEVADLNSDGRLDIAVTEERYPGSVKNSNLYWYEQTGQENHVHWIRHLIVTQSSMNSLDAADMDRDGDIDIITCEHRMPQSGARRSLPNSEKLQIWVNDGKGNFTEKLITPGKESHLGARVADLDADGDLDIVSTAWRNYKFLHLWRNDSIRLGNNP